MPIQLRSTEIGGAKFSFMELNPIEAFELEAKVLPVLLGGIGPIIGAIRSSEEAQNAAFATAIDSMFKAMPPEKLSALMIEIVGKYSYHDGANVRPVSLEGGDLGGPKHMATRYGLVRFFLDVHFRDFIEGQLGEIQSLMSSLAPQTHGVGQEKSEAA